MVIRDRVMDTDFLLSHTNLHMGEKVIRDRTGRGQQPFGTRQELLAWEAQSLTVKQVPRTQLGMQSGGEERNRKTHSRCRADTMQATRVEANPVMSSVKANTKKTLVDL
eukprot:6316672-Amphidinium_carterae.1